MQPPAWLPYRIRQRWNHARVVRAIRGLERTRPVPAATPADAHVDIHMLLCWRDVEIGVLALKSLLRFRDAAWSVALTDDGSVTRRQRQWVNAHVPGCRWLPPVDRSGAVAPLLANRPRLQALYGSSYQLLRKLIHPIALSRCPRVMVLDPDTAFFRRPEALIDWAGSPDAANLFLHDHQPEEVNVPEDTRIAFEKLRRVVAPDGEPWSMPYYFFNSGLLAYRPRDCDLDLAERYLTWLADAPPRYTTGKPGIWFGDWTREQTAYQLMFARMSPPAEPLDAAYRIGNDPGYTFNHFLWLQLVMPSSLQMLRGLVREMS